MFSTNPVPPIHFGAGTLHKTAELLSPLDVKRALIVADPFLRDGPVLAQLCDMMATIGVAVEIFDAFAGEPKVDEVAACAAQAHNAQVVIGIGGGSALDIAKIAASISQGSGNPLDYALTHAPLPARALYKIMIPTTAGTGSETSATNIFSGADGRKLWIWGAETRADAVILDPTLTVTLPANLTAWCGMDALIHAFEAATSRSTHAGAQIYAYRALSLIVNALPRAVTAPDDIIARGDVLLGSCYAGLAIDTCGTAIAHNLSHAAARFSPVHHGLATAIGFATSLRWLIQNPTAQMHAAAQAMHLKDATQLPEFIEEIMLKIGMECRLPDAFSRVDPTQFAVEMQAESNIPMLQGTARDASAKDILTLAQGYLATAR